MIINGVDTAKRVLTDDEEVQFGIFGIVGTSGYFPPRELLNEFLKVGHDPCDQDGLMDTWPPFALEPGEYNEIWAWWRAAHPDALVSDLGVGTWDEWTQVILHPEDWGYPDGLPHPSRGARS